MIKPSAVPGPKTFTFSVAGFASFQISAESQVKAFEAANSKIRKEEMVEPGVTFAWFDTAGSNSFYLGTNVFMD